MMDKLAILNDLQYGEIDLEGQFLRGSNGTFLVVVRHAGNSLRAVYKPKAGEQPLWDFPQGTLCKREVAAFIFDEALGWNLVPPTVFRRKAPLGAGSLQVFIPHNPQDHYLNMTTGVTEIHRKVLLFDFILNNADRKAGHFIMDDQHHIWLIDHGLTFNEQEKLRTVAWDHAGEEIPSDLQEDIQKVLVDLNSRDGIYGQMTGLLSTKEINVIDPANERLTGKGHIPCSLRRPARHSLAADLIWMTNQGCRHENDSVGDGGFWECWKSLC